MSKNDNNTVIIEEDIYDDDGDFQSIHDEDIIFEADAHNYIPVANEEETLMLEEGENGTIPNLETEDTQNYAFAMTPSNEDKDDVINGDLNYDNGPNRTVINSFGGKESGNGLPETVDLSSNPTGFAGVLKRLSTPAKEASRQSVSVKKKRKFVKTKGSKTLDTKYNNNDNRRETGDDDNDSSFDQDKTELERCQEQLKLIRSLYNQAGKKYAESEKKRIDETKRFKGDIERKKNEDSQKYQQKVDQLRKAHQKQLDEIHQQLKQTEGKYDRQIKELINEHEIRKAQIALKLEERNRKDRLELENNYESLYEQTVAEYEKKNEELRLSYEEKYDELMTTLVETQKREANALVEYEIKKEELETFIRESRKNIELINSEKEIAIRCCKETEMENKQLTKRIGEIMERNEKATEQSFHTNNTLNGEIILLKTKLRDYEREEDSHKEKIRKLSDETDHLHQTKQSTQVSYTRNITDKDRKINSLEQQLNKKRKSKDRLKEEKKILKDENGRLKVEKTQLETEKLQIERDYEAIERRLQQTNTDCEQSKKDNLLLIDTYKYRADEKQRLITGLNQEIQALAKAKQSFEDGEYQMLKKECDKLKREVDQLKKNNLRLTEGNQNVDAEKAKLNEEIASLKRYQLEHEPPTITALQESLSATQNMCKIYKDNFENAQKYLK